MKTLALSLLVAVCGTGVVSAKQEAEAPAPARFVEIRGERLPMYESLKGIGDPSTVKPEFPRDAEGRRVSGTAIVGVLVDEKGAPLEIEVVESKPVPACGENAAAAVKKWRFPKLKTEGRATKYIVRVPFVFDDRS